MINDIINKWIDTSSINTSDIPELLSEYLKAFSDESNMNIIDIIMQNELWRMMNFDLLIDRLISYHQITCYSLYSPSGELIKRFR